MISYIVNLFMVRNDLRRNNGYGESLKKQKKKHIFCVCMIIYKSRVFLCGHLLIHTSLYLTYTSVGGSRLLRQLYRHCKVIMD